MRTGERRGKVERWKDRKKKKGRDIDEEKKKQKKKEEMAGSIFFSCAFSNFEGPKVSISVWLCRDFLVEGFSMGYRGRDVHRDTEKIDSRLHRFFFYILLFFFLVCQRKALFSRRTLVSISDNRRYVSHRIPG